MDRAPKPAPFPVGARLRYIGKDNVWSEKDGQQVPWLAPGMEVVIDEVKEGRRGTLRPLPGEWDDMDETPLDTTRDGRSIFVNAAGHRRIIWPEKAGEWESV